MKVKLFFSLVVLFAVWGSTHGRPSFWDSLPVISQIKSAVQAIGGDSEGARRTQENFLNQMPVLSQLKSAVQAASGDNEGARKTQEQFLHEYIEPIADNTPVIGHVKGGIHIAVGDKERGEQILKGASSSTAMVIGGVVGGPGGAIAAGAAMDGIITVVDSDVHNEYRPFGIVNYASNIDKHSVGEHFDTWTGIGSQFVGGKAATKVTGKQSSFGAEIPFKAANEVIRETPRFGAEVPLERTLSDAHGSVVSTILREETPRFGGEIPLKRKLNDPYGPEGGIVLRGIKKSRSSNRARLNAEIPESRMDLSKPAQLDLARQKSGLPDILAKRLEPADFRVVNDVEGSMNCYYCSLAAMKGKTVTELMNEIGVMMEADGAPGIQYIVDLYKEAGFKDAKMIFEGDTQQFYNFLDKEVGRGETKHFSVPFLRKDGTGHVVHVRSWKTLEGSGYVLITDFQKPPFSLNRFSTRLPNDLEKVYAISAAEISELGDLDAASRSNIYQTHLQRP